MAVFKENSPVLEAVTLQWLNTERHLDRDLQDVLAAELPPSYLDAHSIESVLLFLCNRESYSDLK